MQSHLDHSVRRSHVNEFTGFEDDAERSPLRAALRSYKSSACQLLGQVTLLTEAIS